MILSSKTNKLNERSNRTLAMIDKWMMENGMSLVEEKTEPMIMKGPRNREGVKICLKNKVIEFKKELKFLGV